MHAGMHDDEVNERVWVSLERPANKVFVQVYYFMGKEEGLMKILYSSTSHGWKPIKTP